MTDSKEFWRRQCSKCGGSMALGHDCIQTPAPKQEGCDHGKGENIHPPIYWNSFNQVYQCHKCGQVFIPEIQLAEKDRRITELELQIENFLDYGQGGASFKESQLHAKIEQLEQMADKLAGALEKIRSGQVETRLENHIECRILSHLEVGAIAEEALTAYQALKGEK